MILTACFLYCFAGSGEHGNIAVEDCYYLTVCFPVLCSVCYCASCVVWQSRLLHHILMTHSDTRIQFKITVYFGHNRQTHTSAETGGTCSQNLVGDAIANVPQHFVMLHLYRRTSYRTCIRPPFTFLQQYTVSWSQILLIIFTPCPEKYATLFSTITLASLRGFLQFYTVGNRNKYSTIISNLLT